MSDAEQVGIVLAGGPGGKAVPITMAEISPAFVTFLLLELL